MVPVNQTIFGFPEGNCQAACLASIFECSIDDVMDDPELPWESRSSLHAEWLRRKGIYMLNFPGPIPYGIPGYLIAAVPSKNHEGKLHAVVWKEGQIVHDPNPNNTPYIELCPVEFSTFCIIDPSQNKDVTDRKEE